MWVECCNSEADKADLIRFLGAYRQLEVWVTLSRDESGRKVRKAAMLEFATLFRNVICLTLDYDAEKFRQLVTSDEELGPIVEDLM